MNPYNPLDYTYTYDVPKPTIRENVLNGTVGISPTVADVLGFIISNDTFKNNINNIINTHKDYINNIPEEARNIIHLWTNPPVCDALQRILRGIVPANSIDLECLNAVLEFNNGDIISRANFLKTEIKNLPTSNKNGAIQTMLMYVLDGFVSSLTTSVIDSPGMPSQFVTFRGINGNITDRYTRLAINDIILERGFTSVTWQPLKAIEYAKGNGSNRSPYLMCVSLPVNTRALSVYTISAYPNDREFLLPAGTVLLKRQNGVFEVIGIYQKFLNRQDNTLLTGWLSNVDLTNRLDQTEADLVPMIMQKYVTNYSFGVITKPWNPSSSTSKHSSKWEKVTPKLFAVNAFNDNRKKQKETKQNHRDLDLPLGVTVMEDRVTNSNGTINVVDLNFDILLNTHTTETTENEKGGISTFFMQKSIDNNL